MEKKKVSIWLVVINCICAIVWDINLMIDIVYGYINTTSFFMHIICAVVWNACAVLWIMRYIKSRKE